MTIKKCMKCGKPFSDKTSKHSWFCSEQCKNEYYDLLDDMSHSDSQIEKDAELKKKADYYKLK